MNNSLYNNSSNTFPATRKMIIVYSILSLIIVTPGCLRNQDSTQTHPQKNIRIISLAPSITETLFALSLGSHLVGVTNFCTYPQAAQTIEKIGTFTDPNLEKILLLHPSIVILMKENGKVKQFLHNHSIDYLEIENHSITQLCQSFINIGTLFNREEQAQGLVKQFTALGEKKKVNQDIPSVMICVGRDGPGSGIIRNVFIAGNNTFYSDIIRLAGGKNCYSQNIPVYPNLSREGISSLSPDIIIDIAPSMNFIPCGTLIHDWKELSFIPAVKNNHVYCIAKTYATIPGPRISLLLEDIREIIKNHRQKLAVSITSEASLQ